MLFIMAQSHPTLRRLRYSAKAYALCNCPKDFSFSYSAAFQMQRSTISLDEDIDVRTAHCM